MTQISFLSLNFIQLFVQPRSWFNILLAGLLPLGVACRPMLDSNIPDGYSLTLKVLDWM